MGTPNGSLGGMAVVAETVYGTTPAVPVWVWQHPVGSTIGNRRPIITPTLLSYSSPSNRKYSGVFADGDYMVGLDLAKAVIGDILGLAGNDVANVFQLGGGGIPDVNSVSLLDSYGGGGGSPVNHHEWIFPGIKPTALKFDIPAESNGILTLVGIGQGGSKTALGSAEDPTPPDENDLEMPTSNGTTIIGLGEAWEETVCLHSANGEVSIPKTGFERRCLGGTMQEPIIAGRPGVSFTLNLDLDDSTNNDTIAILQRFEDGDLLGDIQIGTSLLLKDCIMDGDHPPLIEGAIDFTLNVLATRFDVTTTI